MYTDVEKKLSKKTGPSQRRVQLVYFKNSKIFFQEKYLQRTWENSD